MTTEERLAQLEAENRKLKAKFEDQENSKKNRRKLGWRFLKQSSGFVLGASLKTSIENFLEELSESQKVSRDTLTELLSNIILRLTRIGFFLMLTAILPSILLIFQTYYLAKQNKLIDAQTQLFQNQNTRLDQQTYLQEAERRGAVITLLDNMIKDVNTEVSRSANNRISRTTSGRLIALSKMLKPYRYLQNDSLTKRIVSPERGYLLLSLIESDLSFRLSAANASGSLLKRLDFSYAELPNVSIVNEDLININLSNADLENANLSGNEMEDAQLSYAELTHANLSLANLEGANLRNAQLLAVDFTNTNLRAADLSLANLKNSKFTKAEIIDAKLTNATVSENFLSVIKRQLNKENYNWFIANYEVVEVEDNLFQILQKR